MTTLSQVVKRTRSEANASVSSGLNTIHHSTYMYSTDDLWAVDRTKKKNILMVAECLRLNGILLSSFDGRITWLHFQFFRPHNVISIFRVLTYFYSSSLRFQKKGTVFKYITLEMIIKFHWLLKIDNWGWTQRNDINRLKPNTRLHVSTSSVYEWIPFSSSSTC